MPLLKSKRPWKETNNSGVEGTLPIRLWEYGGEPNMATKSSSANMVVERKNLLRRAIRFISVDYPHLHSPFFWGLSVLLSASISVRRHVGS